MIGDLIQPTGIIIKPSENQLKEFAKRVKSLDKEIIFEMIYEKLLNYENMSDANNSKILMVSFILKVYLIFFSFFIIITKIYFSFNISFFYI